MCAPVLIIAAPIQGDGTLGDFTGCFNYTPFSASESTIEIELTNISPLTNGGYLTAFVFNLPDGYINHVTLSVADDNFPILGGPVFRDRLKGVLYGYYDIGAYVTDQFLGEMSVNANPGQGVQLFSARFRGFDNRGSNKTPGEIIPIPGAVWLLSAGLLEIIKFKGKRRLGH